MTLLVACTNMDHVFRSAFIGSASILFACVGYCLSVVSALLGLLFPDIHERPPARAPPLTIRTSVQPKKGLPSPSRQRRDESLAPPVASPRLGETPPVSPTFNLVVQPVADYPRSPIKSDSKQAPDFNLDRSGAVIDASSDTRESSPPSLRSSTSSTSSSTLIPSPTSSDFCPSQSKVGLRIGRSWTRKKVQSCSSPTDSTPGVKLSRVQTLLPSKTSPKSLEPQVGISKAKSFCIAEKGRKASLKPPVPRPRTQPYDAPYFAPRPISEAGLPEPTIRIVKPSRSSTLPPPRKRRSSPTPTPSDTLLKSSSP
ncbi:hypothetical protein CPB85DRAFT_1264998 [Mucidula mucida]|nr:hypothetical protein CPB85DRAFT_1264998 [Mucidula mucida]